MTLQITRLSSKGQIVLPREIRKKFNLLEGESFSVSTKDNLIVLKKIESQMDEDDLRTFNELKEAWKDIEEGRCKTMSTEDFLKEIEKW